MLRSIYKVLNLIINHWNIKTNHQEMTPKPHTQQHDHSGKGWNHKELSRMWCNKHSHILLVQVQFGTISLEITFTMCPELEDIGILEPKVATPGYVHNSKKCMCAPRLRCQNDHPSIIPNSQKASYSLHGRLHEYYVVLSYNGEPTARVMNTLPLHTPI